MNDVVKFFVGFYFGSFEWLCNLIFQNNIVLLNKLFVLIILLLKSFPIFSEVMLKKIIDEHSYIDTGIRFERMSECVLVVTQNKMLLEMDNLYANFETNFDIQKDNKLKFDKFECIKINNANA